MTERGGAEALVPEGAAWTAATGIRVVEVGGREGGAGYCGKLFARWGAEVRRLELVGTHRDPALHAYLHTGKAVELAPPDAIAGLLGEADVLLCDLSPAEIDEIGLAATATPVKVFITPFGREGRYRDARASAASLLALGGYTFLSGDPGRAPLTMPGRYPYYQAGTFAYVAALSHLVSGGTPVTLDVSVLETVASLHQFTDTFWTYQGIVRSRHGNRWENLCPTTLLPAADGWVAVNILPAFWESFALWVGGPELAADARFATNEQRMAQQDEVEAFAVDAFRDRGMFDLFREGQETWRVPVGYAPSLSALLVDPHLVERGFWQPVAAGVQPVSAPGSPFRFEGELLPEAAPLLPEHGLARRSAATDGGRSATRPLEGVRILDMTRIWSGPLATRMLGDLGADVLKVESPAGRGAGAAATGAESVRPWNQQPLFNKLNRNKRSLALDLKAQGAREVFLRLVRQSDVLVENFSARAMPRLGLGYDVLRAVNPGLVYMQMPALGLFGPYRDYIGLGPSIEPLSGLAALMGYGPSEPRVTAAAITDAAAGTTAAAAILTALSRRLRTGTGAHIDLSQGEAMTALLGEYVIAEQLSGVETPRLGNAHQDWAPYSVYPCMGEDQWICITVSDDDQWQALCEAAQADWATDRRFRTMSERVAHRDELDGLISGWTSQQDKAVLSEVLLTSGVAAGAVQSAPEYLASDQLTSVGYFSVLDVLDAGRGTYDGSPVTADGDRGYSWWRGAPALGQHNNEALQEAGYSDQEIEQFWRDGVIVDHPPSVS